MNHPDSWRTKLHELVKLREGSMQVAQYIAVLAGIRRSMDDWIPAHRFETFQRLATQLGFKIEVDCVFSPVDPLERPFGSEYAPTTKARGRAFIFAEKDQFRLRDEVHVVLARRADFAAETLALVWYPVVIQDRVIYKPSVDVYRLGLAFGYPECCVKAFMAHNDWPRQNTIAEAAKASRRFSWKTNCLAKNTPLMLIFHMPCSFDCNATLEYSSSLIEEVREFDSAVAAKIEALLRQVVLVINERVAFILGNASDAGNGRTQYQRNESLRGSFGIEDRLYEPCRRALGAGTAVSITDGSVIVWDNERMSDVIETTCDRGIAEVPLILDFRAD